MIPIFILYTWLLGLISFGIIGGTVYLGHEWQQRSWVWDPVAQRSFFNPTLGWNAETAMLAGAITLLIIALAGGRIVRGILRATSQKKTAPGESPFHSPKPVSQERLRRPDGSELHVEFYGPEDATPIVLTHGWGFDSREWNYLKQELSEQFRLIVWDEPGLGKSAAPANRDYSLETFAHNLDAVLSLAGNKPAILLGHSIGGMTILTFCRLFPQSLGSRVAGLILTHTTPTDPVHTASGAAFYTAIEKPVLVPLMYLTIALSPLVWLMNWLSYWNGSAHLSTKRGSFGGTETWEQIDFATKFQPQAPPAVLARGMLGMMRYDATSALHSIPIPTLVVAANKDSTTKPEASQEIHSAIPNSQLITLAPAKHLGLIEHHHQYAKAVREFVFSTVVKDNPPMV
ncbi:MAG: Arylesterase [Chthoniobacteraceae bacterium]|nr:Arylesterase [Chthoniobacteraceae bacterium]